MTSFAYIFPCPFTLLHFLLRVNSALMNLFLHAWKWRRTCGHIWIPYGPYLWIYWTSYLYTVCFNYCMLFMKYRKRPVPWNGLKISLTNMSAECLYSCLFRAFLQSICRASFNVFQRYRISDLTWLQRTALSDCL